MAGDMNNDTVRLCMNAMAIPSGRGKKGEEASVRFIDDTPFATEQRVSIDESLSENRTVVQASELTFSEDEPLS